MADDASYNTFLAKVNQDPSAGSATKQSTSQAKSKFDPTTPSISGVPPALQGLDAYYTSDSDEPFQPVTFSYSGDDLPGVEQFKQCLSRDGKGDAAVEELRVGDFDPRGQYKDIIGKVERAGSGQGGVKVFRVEISKTRAVYYIITVGERSLLGVWANAVES